MVYDPVQKFLARTMQSVLSSHAGSLVTGHCLCHSFPLLCAAPPSIPSHPAVVFAPARALLASCPAPPASPCRAAPPPGPPATAPTWTLTPWSADSSLLDCQVNAENFIGSDKLLELLNVFQDIDIMIYLIMGGGVFTWLRGMFILMVLWENLSSYLYKLMQELQDAWIGYCIGGRENIYIMLIKSRYS